MANLKTLATTPTDRSIESTHPNPKFPPNYAQFPQILDPDEPLTARPLAGGAAGAGLPLPPDR